MKEINNYILLVDNHRRASRRRNTAGRYRVGAKTEKEAIKLLREKIKFGSILVYYKTDLSKDIKSGIRVEYKRVVRENSHVSFGKLVYDFKEPISAIDPINKPDEIQAI